MPERDEDPIASTQMFRAFVQRGEPEPPPAARRIPPAAIAAIAAVLVVAVALVIWLVAS